MSGGHADLRESAGPAGDFQVAVPGRRFARVALATVLVITAGYLFFRAYSLGTERVAWHVGRIVLALAPLPAVLWWAARRPAHPGQRAFSASLLQDAAYFFLDLALRLSVLVLLAAGLGTFYESQLSFLTLHVGEVWPPWLRFTAAFLFMDFLGWMHHVVRHKVPLFWAFHTIHHSQEQMNFFTNARVHLLDTVIARLIIFVPMLTVKLSPPVIFGFAILMAWHRCIYHSNLRTNYGWLRYLLVTPQSHRIHHSTLPEHHDRNFGVNLSIWDHLFGTQYRNYDDYPVTGLGDESFPHERSPRPVAVMETLVAQFLYPFERLLATEAESGALVPERH